MRIIPKRMHELKEMANNANNAMLEQITCKDDMEFGFVIGRILLSLSHTVVRLLPYEEDEEK